MIDGRIKIRHLQCFLETARLGHVGKAAERLCVTQPAVSKTIRELEDILAVQLFERSGRGLILTRVGRLFRQHAQTGVTSLQQAIDSVTLGHLPGLTTIRVGALPTVAARLAPHAVEHLFADRPDAHVILLTGHNRFLYDRLRNRDLDIVVGRTAEYDQMIGLSFEHLYSERLALVVRPDHPLLDDADPDLHRILEYTLIMPTAEDIIRPTLDRFLIARGIGLIGRHIETVSSEFSRSLVRSSDAVWIISFGVVALDLAAGVLAELPFDMEETGGSVGMSTRADETVSALTLSFMSAIRSVAALRVRADHGLESITV